MIPSVAVPLKAGDTVQLKSGGPVMTVAAVAENGAVTCSWFSEKEKRESHFANAQLRKVLIKRPVTGAKK
jgi:uncharacterized protein YodC (DUF2158 family)